MLFLLFYSFLAAVAGELTSLVVRHAAHRAAASLVEDRAHVCRHQSLIHERGHTTIDGVQTGGRHAGLDMQASHLSSTVERFQEVMCERHTRSHARDLRAVLGHCHDDVLTLSQALQQRTRGLQERIRPLTNNVQIGFTVDVQHCQVVDITNIALATFAVLVVTHMDDVALLHKDLTSLTG